jgi:predicted HAD superfamily hydrolase
MVNKGFGRGVLAAERRIAAELIASRFHQHPNLEQIMSFFPFGWTAQEEIAFEASLLTPNPFFLKWISKAPRDIPILYISDMYLSEQTVHAFLVSLGFPAKKNNVFTSATRGCSKRDHGSLFKLALQTIDHHGMAHHCHIGDHWQADIHNAPPDSHTLWLHTPSSWHTSTRGPFFNAHLDVRTHIAQDALRHLANDPHLP